METKYLYLDTRLCPYHTQIETNTKLIVIFFSFYTDEEIQFYRKHMIKIHI